MTNPYAPPKDLSDNILVPGFQTEGSEDLHIEGDAIVCADHATFPDRCVVCNAPTNTPKHRRKMYWHPSWIYLLVLLNWLIYLIVALIVRQTGTVHYSLCEAHRQRRTMGLLITWIGFPLSFVAMIAAAVKMGQNESLYGMMLIFSLLGIVTLPIIGAIGGRSKVGKVIDNLKWSATVFLCLEQRD